MKRIKEANETAARMIAIGAIAVIALAGIMFGTGTRATQQVPLPPAPTGTAGLGGGFSVDNTFYLSQGSGVASQAGEVSATSSVTFMTTTDTASSTITGFAGDNTTSFDLNMIVTASSTASKVLWTVAWSPNKIDWYCEDGSTLNSSASQTHSAQCLVHDWTPGTTARILKNVGTVGIQSKHFRVTISTAAANASIWAAAITKSGTPN